ncbi:DUF1934 domain-containing protein [Desulfovibrio piger]|uniref:DUF1934 domain-containing protein n=1 Tax=Desulfovibrio piger TaxID=901 RepID=UPI0026EDDA74|nr:DUF1934 domain-containing protein [Desulfovibrio piger]
MKRALSLLLALLMAASLVMPQAWAAGLQEPEPDAVVQQTQPDTAETHKVTFTMQDGVVTMSREGDYRTSMIFSQGNRYESSYNTPYGALDMGIFPTQVKYSVDDARGEVLLKYQLDIQGQYSSMREMRIRFAPSHRA